MAKKNIGALLGLFFIGCVLILSASYMKKNRARIQWNGEQYNIENVNKIDATFARPYNKALDKTGDVFVILANLEAVIIFAVVFFTAKDKKRGFINCCFDVFLYGLCYFYTNGIYKILKTLAGRIRPYMYFPNPSIKGIEKFDFNRSWPSGHSANVFFVFGFLLGWLTLRHSEIKCRKILLIIELVICVTTMVLRMLSGNHFLTDVLSGATIGFVSSYGMFRLCNKLAGQNE